MLEYRNDPEFRIDYDQVINKIAFPLNRVGHLTVVPILPPTGDLVLDDDNSMAVDGDTGSDSTGDGTAANPFATIVHGMDSTTEVKPYVRVMNSGLYNEDLSTFTNRSHFAGLYAKPGETPTIDYKILGFTPSNSNSIFVKKTGSDTTGNGTMENPVLTIEKALTLVDSTHGVVCIMDSGVYIEKLSTLPQYFSTLCGVVGHTPHIDITPDLTKLEMDESSDTSIMTNVRSISWSGSWPLATITLPYAITSTDGKIFIFYTLHSATGAYYIVLDSSFNVIKTATLFASGQVVHQITGCNLPNGKLFIAYTFYDSDPERPGRYFVLDTSTYTITNSTIFNYVTHRAIADLSCAYNQVSGKIGILAAILEWDELRFYEVLVSTMSVVNMTILYPNTSDIFNCVFLHCFSDGRWVMAFRHYSGSLATWSNKVEFRSLDFSTVLASTTFDSSISTFRGCVFERAELILLGGPINSGWSWGLFDYDFNEVTPFTEFTASGLSRIAAFTMLSDDRIMFLHQNSTVAYYRILDLHLSLIKPYGALTIIGCNIKIQDDSMVPCLTTGIQPAGTCVIKYSSISSFRSLTLNRVCTVIDSTGFQISIENSKITDCDIGLFSDHGLCSIKDSQFSYISRGYAIHIKGTAAALGDIILDQLDIFNNYGGVYAEDWGGTNEIIRNSIFYLNGAYDVFSDDNQITVGYSIMTGAVNSLVAKQNCLAKNPLYINEGAYNPDDLDLNIKMRILGYKADSPAYQLADATPDRNAGSLNVIYVGAMDTWSTIFLPKPVNGFNVGYRLIGADTLEKLEGADSKVDAILEEVQSEYADGLEWENFQKILTLFSLKKSLVKIFPDPVTYPDFHNEYMIDWEKCKLPGSGGHIKFDQRGVKGVILAFIRGYV